MILHVIHFICDKCPNTARASLPGAERVRLHVSAFGPVPDGERLLSALGPCGAARNQTHLTQDDALYWETACNALCRRGFPVGGAWTEETWYARESARLFPFTWRNTETVVARWTAFNKDRNSSGATRAGWCLYSFFLSFVSFCELYWHVDACLPAVLDQSPCSLFSVPDKRVSKYRCHANTARFCVSSIWVYIHHSLRQKRV